MLSNAPVDLLVLGSLTLSQAKLWRTRVSRARKPPKLVLEFWTDWSLLHDSGPAAKTEVAKWEKIGHETSCRLINNLQVGGVADQTWLVVAREREAADDAPAQWVWPDLPEMTERPFQNCLRPCNIPRKAYRNPPEDEERPADCQCDPMPSKPGSFILTPKGSRRLLNDELANGLGIPKSWTKDLHPKGSDLGGSVSLHLLESLGGALLRPASSASTDSPSGSPCAPMQAPDTEPIECQLPDGETPFNWVPPDLAPVSPWHRRVVLMLLFSCLLHPRPGVLIEEGLLHLRAHRRNCNRSNPDPQRLQLLWWMFPPEHWDALRDGGSMNFIAQPCCGITPNSPMDDDQIQIAEEFLDKLVDLGVLLPAQEGEMAANGPLFCIPKPGQPGQWRVISNMKRGGQNAAIAPDPTVFPKSGHILDQLRVKGWSAVADASKFFYQFKTRPDERPCLGCVHPRHPNKHCACGGLPMGAGNSPSLAGRHRAAFLELLRLRNDTFRGELMTNAWWSQCEFEQPYRPAWGHGVVPIGSDGLPAVLTWGHCDDFFTHGPTFSKMARALHSFLDLAVDVGLLCHPGKLTPPAQVVKHTGLLFDTKDVPTLRIPPCKVDKGRALVSCAVQRRREISRLALAVVAGVLESLVEATPSLVGHANLRHLQDDLHPPGWEGPDLPCFSFVELSDSSVEELSLWDWLLELNPGRPARGSRAGTLIPTFGDGSGTGTGGTVFCPDGVRSEMWMGVWSPRVFHFSSNWKEARTLSAALERAREASPRMDLRGATFFYFADNSTACCTVSSGSSKLPGIHRLARRIKQLEIELGICLEATHVPGTTIITQGTDGLSRGVWMSALQDRPTQRAMLSAIFAPIPFSPDVGAWALNVVGLPPTTRWTHLAWNRPVDPACVRHRVTIWTPPPEIAYQVLYQLLQCCMQSPMDASCIVLVPQIMPRRWSRLTKVIIEAGVFPRDVIPFVCHSPISVPVVVLFIPAHTRCATGCRLDSATSSALRFRHRQLATFCCFCNSGFEIDSRKHRPCLSRYHPDCFRIGLPFTSRLAQDGGLALPKDVAIYRHFICEACIVRSVPERELTLHAKDTVLLMLERARFIDLTNHWAKGSLKTYRSKANILLDFEGDFGVPVCRPTVLIRPPHGEAIKIMWAQERCSLCPSDWFRSRPTRESSVSCGSIRAIRSAASHFWTWDLLASHPERLTLGCKDRLCQVDGCSPTDEAMCACFADGMKRRLGDHPRPSAVLLIHHILWINDRLEDRCRAAQDVFARVEICRFAVAHGTAHAGWLRAHETFGFNWEDVQLCLPSEGPLVGLPAGIGVILLCLLEQTKSSQDKRVDVILAHTLASGLQLGRWYRRLWHHLPPNERAPAQRVLAHRDGRAWTSHCCRHTHLCPMLFALQSIGDPCLAKHDPAGIKASFWGFHTNERTGRSVVSRKRPQTHRSATAAEVIEHGRWRVSRTTLDMPLACLDWSIEDRICVTQFCM